MAVGSKLEVWLESGLEFEARVRVRVRVRVRGRIRVRGWGRVRINVVDQGSTFRQQHTAYSIV